MNSPNPEFPGEDFFHPGFTPASFSPRSEPPAEEASGKQQQQQQQPPQKPQNSIPRRPLPSPRHSLAAAPTETVNTPALGLGLGSGTEPWPREKTSEGPETPVIAGNDRGAGAGPSTAPSGSGNGLAPAKVATDEVSAPSSTYGESGLPSASPSHPSPPPPWPASPHVQRDYAFSQLHGANQVPPSHPVSPISDSENFSSRDASRANSLAYRVSQRTMPRTVDSSGSRRDAPLPPLPQESPLSRGSPGEAAPVAGVVQSPALSHGCFAGAAQGISSDEHRASLKRDWPLEQHAAAVGEPDSRNTTQRQSQTLQLPFQREDTSPVHETPLSQRPPSPEFYTPLAAMPPQARFSAQQQQQPTPPRRTSQRAFSPYLPSSQQQPRFSHHRPLSHQSAAFSSDRGSVQGPLSPSQRRTTPPQTAALHPLQQHPPPAHYRASAVGGSGGTPFMQQYEEGSVFGPTADTSTLKEEEAELGRGMGAAATPEAAAGGRRLSAQSRSGAASARSVWSGYRASWLPEVLWCLVAVACLGIIGVLLSRYDGRALAAWPLPVTLNALVAFLASVCHAALLFPVLEGLGQLKWNWFARRDRSLADFQAFEDARRGPFGAVRLAFVTKGRCLSLLATIIMLTSVVTSPLTQMIIEYPTRLTTVASQASEVQGVSYPFTDTAAVTGSTADLDIRQKQSIQLGIYSPVDLDVTPLPPICGPKGCQSQTFSSLSVCSRTEDVTSRLSVSDPVKASELDVNLNLPSATLVRNASLPNGVYLVGSADTYNLNMSTPASARAGSSPQPLAGSLSFTNQSDLAAAAISNFFVIYTNSTRQPSPKVTPSNNRDGDDDDDDDDDDKRHEEPVSFRAVEVLLHFCVGTYEATAAGKTVRKSTTTDLLLPPAPRGQPKSLVVFAAQAGRNYSVDPEAVRPLSGYMTSAFAGAYSAGMGPAGAAVVGYTGTSDAFGSAMFGAARARGQVFEKDGSADETMRQAVANITGNVAMSLTNTIRSFGATTAATATEAGSGPETFVSVRWGWLAVLAAQVLLSAAFLAGVALQTSVSGTPVLKASGGGGLAALLAVPADDKRALLEREGGVVGCHLDEGRAMAARLEADGIRGRFAGDADRGWAMDLGVRVREG
ncbi:hypothetical protein RB594_000946 [Gaeumannomyces avenae]